jgi:hypothetical protein
VTVRLPVRPPKAALTTEVPSKNVRTNPFGIWLVTVALALLTVHSASSVTFTLRPSEYCAVAVTDVPSPAEIEVGAFERRVTLVSVAA